MAAEPVRPEPVLRNGRGHNSERPAYRKKKKKYNSIHTLEVQIQEINLVVKGTDFRARLLEFRTWLHHLIV